MIIIDWLKWKWYTWRYAFSIERDARGKYMVVCKDRWNNQTFNASGRLLSKANAEKLIEELRSFKTFRDSKTEEGQDFENHEVKAWMKRQRHKKFGKERQLIQPD